MESKLCKRLLEENFPLSNFCLAWNKGLESVNAMLGFSVSLELIWAFSMPLCKKYASTSQGDHCLRVSGSLQPKLKLGRNPCTPGLARNILVPPAGRLVQASVAKYRVSPLRGTVTDIGLD